MKQKNERSVEDKPIFKDISEDVTTHFIFSHSKHSDEITIVLKAHLFVEYMLDMLIKKKVKKANLILKYNFAKKLDIFYSFDLIPHYLYNNISTLNAYRNKLAHNLNYDLSKETLIFYDEKGSEIKPNKKFYKLSIKTKISSYCYLILNQINRHYIENLKIAPVFL